MWPFSIIIIEMIDFSPLFPLYSILIHLYAEDSSSPLDVNNMATSFQGYVDRALSDGNRKVIPYPGQTNIRTFDLSATTAFQNGVPLYAGDTSSDGATPINLAVFLGSYAGMKCL